MKFSDRRGFPDRDERFHAIDQRADLFLGGRIDGIQPMRARQVILLSGFRFDVLDLEWDDDQFAVGGQDKFAADIFR